MYIKNVLNKYGPSLKKHCKLITNKIISTLYRQLVECKVHQVALLELMYQLGSNHHVVKLIQNLTYIRDIDILLEKHNTHDFISKMDTFLHDIPFRPFFWPSLNIAYVPNEIYINKRRIWHTLFWLYSQNYTDDTCSNCLEHTTNI